MIRVLTLGLTLLATATVASAQPPAAEPRFYTSAEYLLWWLKDSPAPPPLLSTGGLDDPDFSPVLGSRPYDTGLRQGGRFTAGFRITPDWALEGIGFFLAGTPVTKTVSSSGAPGSPQLVAPQFRVDESREGFLFLATPSSFAADARESLRSAMSGAELNVVRRMVSSGGWRVDALGGFRYLRLNEELSFAASSVSIPAPDVFTTTDVFATDNHFYGGQVGVKAEYAWGGWFAQGTAKVALGVMRESIDIAGSLLTNDFNNLGTPQTFPGGIFAQPTNIGHHRRDRFAVVPEAGLKVGYRLTSWASVFLGYTFLYASNVVRPGNQIDRSINTTQALAFQIPQSPPPSLALVGPARPAVRFREADVWVQGLSVGVAFGF